MAGELEIVRLVISLVPEATEAIAALVEALDSGKTEAEALAAARAHLPDRIDTTAEDADRRRRFSDADRMRHLIRGGPPDPSDVATHDTEPPPAGE